jgi:hypothetical protein
MLQPLQQNGFSSHITGFLPQSCPQCMHSTINQNICSGAKIEILSIGAAINETQQISV